MNIKGGFKGGVEISRKKHGSDIQEEPELEEIEDIDQNFDSPSRDKTLKVPYSNQESAISFKATKSNNIQIDTRLARAINESFGPGDLQSPDSQV